MSLRPFHTRRLLFVYAILFVALTLYCFRDLISTAYALASLPFIWTRDESSYLISPRPDRDAFDLTFANYSRTELSAGPQYPDLVPGVLHHIALGRRKPRGKWVEARNACLDLHPGWEAMMWTDENASDFVREKYPELYDMWENYPFHIQKIDALRYLVLYEYGGECSSAPSCLIGAWGWLHLYKC